MRRLAFILGSIVLSCLVQSFLSYLARMARQGRPDTLHLWLRPAHAVLSILFVLGVAYAVQRLVRLGLKFEIVELVTLSAASFYIAFYLLLWPFLAIPFVTTFVLGGEISGSPLSYAAAVVLAYVLGSVSRFRFEDKEERQK